MSAFRRSGLHRLSCSSVACDGYAYGTVACLERFGLPACGCGAPLVPERLELAELLGVACDAVAEYQHEVNSIARGQAGPGRALRNAGRALQDPSLLAAERVERRRQERARSNRLSALRMPEPAMPF